MTGNGLDSQQAVARAYYRAIDGGDYDLLAEILRPSFVQERPDVRLEGRDRFLQFMREGRPTMDTSHEIQGIYRGTDDGAGILVRGRLLAPDGDPIVRFVDCFTFEGKRIYRIETYSR